MSNEITAVVTGASRGIGREIAKHIALGGGQVALVARTLEGLEETDKIIREAGGKSKVFATDLRYEDEINQMVSNVKDSMGEIDFVINVAGVWHNETQVYQGPNLANTPAEQINEVLDVGIRAPMLLTRLFLPEMIQRQRGKIINISGTFFAGAAGWLHYYVSKKAIERFTVGLAEELKGDMIQVNCISPADCATEPYKRFFPEYFADAISPEEIAKMTVFLLSEKADHITGQIIVVWNKNDKSHYPIAQ